MLIIEETLRVEERVIRKQELKQPLFYDAQQLVPPAAGNFYLRLEEAVKGWERLAQPFAAAFSAGMGRPTDPVVYLKIFLIGYLENIVYDTDLAERIADSLAIRKFLDYALTEAPPDHASISRNRALIGERGKMEQVLERVVGLCMAQGLVQGKEVAVDSTLIPANASLSSLRSIKTGKGVREHLREVRKHNKASEKPEKLKVSNEAFRSRTDEDARLTRKPGSPRGMYYKGTHVTDGANGIILAAGCERADVGDIEAATPVVEQSQRTLPEHALALGTVVADAGYDGAEFHAAVEELGATPLTNYKPDNGQKPEGFPKADFSYDRDEDCYTCPAGKRLARRRVQEGAVCYQTSPGDCIECEHRAQCVGEHKAPRQIKRSRHEESRQRNLARCHTDEGRGALRRRRHIVEPPFGHMKTYGGMSRINCRGKPKATVKVVLAAVAWNLIKLVGALARRAEAAPAASAGAIAGWIGRAIQALWTCLLHLPRSVCSRLTSPVHKWPDLPKASVLR